MRVRHPPGRAGRPWLVHRLEVARRGAELLDDKQRALQRERARLLPEISAARERWQRLATDAERWLARAAVLGAGRQLAAVVAPAELKVRWHAILGVTCPAGALLEYPPGEPPPGAGAALIESTAAHRRALDAGVRVAVLERALALIDAELRATSLRRNAIRHRWIPGHEEALATLTLTLEELEREDATRVRSIVRRGGP